MSKPNLRVKNTCRQCGSTWSPRGITVSNMCPECGSQDIDVKTRPAPRKTRRVWPTVLLILGVLAVGGGLAAFLVFNTKTEPTPAPGNGAQTKEQAAAVESPFKPGDVVHVKARARNVLMADDDVADELAQLRSANNQAAIIQLLKRDKLAKIPESTKATVLGVSPTGVRVKITEGGWINREGILPADVLEPAK